MRYTADECVAQGCLDAHAIGTLRQERGSGTVLALGTIGVAAICLLMCLALGAAGAGRAHAEAAADLAAVAGATALQGGRDACGVAGATAQMNGAQLEQCRVEGWDVVLVARYPTPILGVVRPALAQSRAGPAA
ncbi:MAG: flp pilus-assembly TadE/G-like family protein [Actinomycetaceae bacterium]|nr:flp pilus-assembly TadE/G-like family protein [Actinomycetaceae bacterium]